MIIEDAPTANVPTITVRNKKIPIEARMIGLYPPKKTAVTTVNRVTATPVINKIFMFLAINKYYTIL